MALGRRRTEREDAFWVSTEKLGGRPCNVFVDRLNGLLAEASLIGSCKRQRSRTARRRVARGCHKRSPSSCDRAVRFKTSVVKFRSARPDCSSKPRILQNQHAAR